jgi:two-component system, LytTR family, response regulator
MIQCVVIDDNDESIKLIVRHIQSKPELELKATFSNSVEGLRYIENNAVALVFVDIQMPDLNGLELMDALNSKLGFKAPHFILITGYSEYALESYDYGVKDYLLKPVTFKRFSIAVDRYISNATNHTHREIQDNFFFAEVEGVKTRINSVDIAYVEGAGNYISVFCKPSRILLHKTLNAISDLLDAKQFIRIHKSVLVSVSHITGVRGNELFIDYNGKSVTLPIGVTYRKAVMDRLNII